MLFKKDKPDEKALPLERVLDPDGVVKSITCMTLSDDQSLLVSGSDDGTIRMFSTKTQSMECLGIFRGHTDYVTCIVLYDTHVVTGSADGSVRKWDMATCECLDVYLGHASRVFSLVCSGDSANNNGLIFSTSYDKTARAWRFDTSDLDDEEDPCLRIFQGHSKAVLSCVHIPGDDLSTGYNFDNDGNGAAGGDDGEDKNAGDDDCMMNPSDKFITGSADCTAKSWSLETGACLKTFKGHKGPISCISVDETGAVLFTASMDKTVRSWDTSSGRCLKVFEGHENGVLSMVLSRPPSSILYTGSSDGSARAWVAEFGECTRTFKGHGHSVTCLALAGGLLFTGCGDQVVRAFDAKSGALRRAYKGHTAGVVAVVVADTMTKTKTKTGSAADEGGGSGMVFSGGSDGALIKWSAKDLLFL